MFERFLAWCQSNRAPRTYEWSRDHIQSFCDDLKARGVRPDGLPAADLTPLHVTEWVDGKKQPRPGRRPWGANHCRGAITAVQRAFAWAARERLIPKNPVRGVEKPAPVRREQVLTRAEFDHPFARVRDGAFRDVLEFCWETGCRVQEVRQLEAAHHKPHLGRFELHPRQAKGKKRWRLIYLTPRAEAVARPLVARHPDGPVFRNADGNPWSAQAFNCRFVRLQRRLGREALGGAAPDPAVAAALARRLKPTRTVGGVAVPKSPAELLREARRKLSGAAAARAGTKYALTSFRHSYATRLLEAGCDHVTVSALLGHVDAVMLSRVYSHVGDRADFLRDALVRASGGRTPA